MNKEGVRLSDYLSHILQAISRIERYTQNLTQGTFLADEQVQDAVIRNIEIIGEAARNIERHSPEFAAQHPEIPWGDMYAMRNVVAHGYFTVDLEIVWKTIHGDLRGLAEQIANVKKTLPK